MKSTVEYGNAVRTVFQCPASPLTKFVKVNAVLATVTSQTENSVVLSSAPASNAYVEIFYGNDIVIPPAVRTVSGVSAVMSAPPADKGLTLFMSITAGSGTLDCSVQQLDLISGVWFSVPGASFAQATSPTNVALTIFPGAQSSANVSVNGTIRNQYRINYVMTGAGFTFSIGAQAY